MNREEMLARFSRGQLGEADRRALFEAALDDQELFDALAEEDALRDVLDHPDARQVVLARLKPAPVRSRARAWRLPAVVAASLAAALAVVMLRPPSTDLIRVAGPPNADVANLWSYGDEAAKAIVPLSAQLRLSAPGPFRAGEAVGLEVQVSEPAAVAVLLRPPDGAARQLFPLDSPTARLSPPGGPIHAPRERTLTAPSAPGRYALRLLAIRDSGAPADFAALRSAVASGEAAIADVAFEVVE